MEDTMPKRTRIISPQVPEPPPQRWSNCLRVGDMLFISGMVARNGDRIEGADEYEQARVIFGKIRHLVEAAGGKVDDVVKITVFLTNIRNNTKVWKARAEVFSGDFPASTLVEVRALASPEILVEIEAIAIVGSSS
jgi:enamine deaminase RidA (YjgF/YER057c/UK114 family)